MFCSKCGSILNNEEKFCHSCGTKVKLKSHDSKTLNSLYQQPSHDSSQTFNQGSTFNTKTFTWDQSTLKKIFFIFLSGLIILVTLCFFLEDFEVSYVKDSTIENYESKTVGTAFEDFFDKPAWTYFNTDSGQDIVEFEGLAKLNGTEATFLLQFTVYEEDDYFEITYYEINGVQQTYYDLIDLLDVVYE